RIDTPANDTEGGVIWGGGMRLRRGRGIPEGREEEKNEVAQELAVVDAKGRSFKVVQTAVRPAEKGSPQEAHVTFQPQSGLAVPSRLIYTGQRKFVMDVPFTLKNIPLP